MPKDTTPTPLGESLPDLRTMRSRMGENTPTGKQLSETVSEASITTPTALEVIHGGTVAGRDDALLESVRQLAGSSLEEIKRTWFDDWGYDYELIGYSFAQPVTIEALESIDALVVEANRPATRREVGPMLGAMSEGMPSGDGSNGESWLELVWLAVEELPADVILEALKNIVKREKWRPAASEIREECWQLGERRRALLKLELAG